MRATAVGISHSPSAKRSLPMRKRVVPLGAALSWGSCSLDTSGWLSGHLTHAGLRVLPRISGLGNRDHNVQSLFGEVSPGAASGSVPSCAERT